MTDNHDRLVTVAEREGDCCLWCEQRSVVAECREVGRTDRVRRTNVVQIFPNDAAIVRLVGAVLAEQHDDWATHRHYLSEASMARLYPTRDNDNATGTEMLAIT